MEEIELAGQRAAHVSFGGRGPRLHFYHANGYPPGLYAPLLKRLAASFEVDALALRAMWPGMAPPPPSLRWMTYADDLIAYLDDQRARGATGPVLGVGHSMGATSTLIAAVKRPDLFSALVLIEPAAVPRYLSIWDTILPYGPRRFFMQPGKRTLERRDRWESRAAFLAPCRQWKSLSGLDDEAFAAFGEHYVQDRPDGGVELAFPKAWEAHNFFCPRSLWHDLARVGCPVTALRGEESVFFSAAMWRKWKRMRPQDTIHELPGYGHLLPMEAPEQCARIIQRVALA